MKKKGERDLQDPELSKCTNNKLTQEEISTISPAATTDPVFCILSACASMGPPPVLHDCLYVYLLKNCNEVATAPFPHCWNKQEVSALP